MPMKISLALGPRKPLSRQTAWGCLTTNVTLPGAGSLVAGRVSGYAQLVLALGGLVITFALGGRFLFWYVANWGRFHDPSVPPLTVMLEMWRVLRWPLLGMALFVVGWLWAFATSLRILREAKRDDPSNPPPRL